MTISSSGLTSIHFNNSTNNETNQTITNKITDTLFAFHNPQDFFRSGHTATIIECGHGAGVANAFLSESGASNFVMESKQPYSKMIQEKLYGTHYKRSVSKEFIDAVFKKELREIPENVEKHVTVASSFQLGDDKSLTHGYVGIAETTGQTSKTTIYHMSFYRKSTALSKINQINQIGTEIINVMAHHILGFELKSYAIDAVWGDQGKLLVDRTLEISTSENFENFICFKKVGEDIEHIRFEDVVRENRGSADKGILFQKGSFDKTIAANAKERYPNYPHAMVISGTTNLHSVITKRVKALTDEGFTVIVANSDSESDNQNHISHHYGRDFKVIFPVAEPIKDLAK